MIENIRFGSKINQTVIDKWFEEYTLKVEDKFVVYDELESLQVEVIGQSKNTLKTKLNRLYICIAKESQIKRSTLIKWFNQNNINEHIKIDIEKNLARRGLIVVEDKVKETEYVDIKIFDDLLEDDLDTLLDDESFIEHVDLLEDVIDKSRNIEYLTQIHAGDEFKRIKSLGYLIEANKRLVWKVVKHYLGKATVGFDQSDMFQAGVIGLLKAVDKFDVSMGNQFSTYAIYWIRQAITRGIADHSTLIRIPVYYREKMNKFLQVEKELWNELARPATTFELSEKMEEPLEIIEEIRFYILQSNLDSLDRLVGEDKTTSLVELVLNNNANYPEDEFTKVELGDTINNIFESELTKRELEVLNYRFGLINDDPKTLEDIGRIFNVTRERIRQIEAKALSKLRKPKTTEILKEYFYEH